MTRQSVDVDWYKPHKTFDINPILKRYENFLRSQGYRASTIIGYRTAIKRYLTYTNSNKPAPEDAAKFRGSLIEAQHAPSTVNHYSAAIKAFHGMYGEEVALKMLPVHNQLPHFFDEDDILKIFSVCKNLKHYAMLSTAFYCLLRASELCELDLPDIDLKNLNLHVRNGKGGKSAVVPIAPDCAEILKQYLEVRPPLEINGREPLFYTDYLHRWERRTFLRMFMDYKKLAGINKPGAVHCFARHSPASILIKNGCDLLTIKELMRHENLTTTARYLHVADNVKRDKYERFLVL